MMKVKDKIYIENPGAETCAALLPHLTYKNPDYYQRANLGISVWNVPKELKTYEYRHGADGSSLSIARGEALKVKGFFPDRTFSFEHPDHPISLQYINNDFNLDEYQEGAITAIKGKRQGIIHAVTSAGKSLIILKAICELRQKAVVVVHRKVLMQQLLEDIDKYIRDENGNKITPGLIGNGVVTDGPITLAIDKTLAKNIDRYREAFGVAILDECHIAPANTIFTLLNSLNTKHRFGFSGTLKRKDQKEFLIYATFGEVIWTITKDQLLDKERIVPVYPKIIESETRFDWDSVVDGLIAQGEKNPTTKARHLQEKTIALDPGRNDLILSLVAGLKGKTIVLSRYVDPCYRLQEALGERYGIKAGVITGQDAKEALASYDAMKHADLQVIFATIGCVSTGVSISDLDNVVLISPLYTNELLLHQIRGRLMRKAEGKEYGVLYFIYDPYIFAEYKLKRFLNIMKK